MIQTLAIDKFKAVNSTEEETEQHFIALAEQSWQKYEGSGLHISLGEAKTWVNTLIEYPSSVPVECHK